MKKLLLLVLSASTLVSCSTAPSTPQSYANAQAVNELKQVPSWALAPDKTSSNGFQAVGMGSSDNLQIAIRKAQLEAEFSVAKVCNQVLSGSERSRKLDSDGRSNDQYEGLIDKIVDEVPLTGYLRLKQEVTVVNGRFNAYVLIELPYQEFDRIMKAKQLAKATPIDDSFNELHKRINQLKESPAAPAAI